MQGRMVSGGKVPLRDFQAARSYPAPYGNPAYRRIAEQRRHLFVSRNNAIANIVCEPDGAAVGIWTPFRIRSAFQPIFAFREGRLVMGAFEGLARPFRNGAPVSPGTFFGLIPPADRFAVEGMLRNLHLLNAATFLPPDSSVFINFDPSVLTDRLIVDQVVREMHLVLRQAAIEPGRIVCEITEHRLSSTSSFLYFLDALRASRFRIAVDDYGAEDSDIERVRSVRPDIIKFDAKWINRLMASGPGYALLAAMMQSFSGQGIVTLLEGIEEGWQLELAERAGACLVQGFAIRRPELVPTSFASVIALQPKPAAAEFKPHPVAAVQFERKPARSFGRRVS